VERIDDSFWHVTLHFGFVEIPDIPSVLGGAKTTRLPIEDKLIYFVERNDLVSRHHRDPISRLRVTLFSFMFRNCAHAIDRFKIPANSLIEIGRRIEL
jgi:KUP system potassium uptake protein